MCLNSGVIEHIFHIKCLVQAGYLSEVPFGCFSPGCNSPLDKNIGWLVSLWKWGSVQNLFVQLKPSTIMARVATKCFWNGTLASCVLQNSPFLESKVYLFSLNCFFTSLLNIYFNIIFRVTKIMFFYLRTLIFYNQIKIKIS